MAMGVRRDRLIRLIEGVLAGAAITVAGIAALSLAVMYANVGDDLLTAFNQVLKIVSVFLGVLFAIGAGGEKGLLTGAAVGILYILIGYALLCLLGGESVNAGVVAAEGAIGGAVGALSGVVVANLPVRRRAKAR